MPAPTSRRRRRGSSARVRLPAVVATMRSALPASVRDQGLGWDPLGRRRPRRCWAPVPSGWAPVRRSAIMREMSFMPSLDRQISESRRAVEKRRHAKTAGRRSKPRWRRCRRSGRSPSGSWARRSPSSCGRASRMPGDVLAEAAEGGDRRDRGRHGRGAAGYRSGDVAAGAPSRASWSTPTSCSRPGFDGAHGVVLIAEALDDDDGLFHDMQAVAWDIGPGRGGAGRERRGARARARPARSRLVSDPKHRRTRRTGLRAHLLVARGGAGRQDGDLAGRDPHARAVIALEGSGVDAAMIGRWVCDDGLRASLDMLRGALAASRRTRRPGRTATGARVSARPRPR